MLYTMEFEIFEEEGGYVALPLGCDGATEGDTFDEAVEMAADWLRTMVLDALAMGHTPPCSGFGHSPAHSGKVVAIAVEASLSDVPAMSAAEAAAELGISTARVAQLCRDGLLDSWKVGPARMVSRDSVAYRKACPPSAGRPRHETALALA